MSEYGIDSVERALQLLDVFDDTQEAFELRELAAKTGFTKPMIMRLTASLERYGHINRDPSGRYRLGPSLWRLGARYRSHYSIEDVIRPILRDMAERTQETAAFYVRSGERRICLYRENSKRRARHHVEIGDEMPLNAGAAGHLILAFTGAAGDAYDAIRARRYQVSHGERDADVSGIAAPVFRGGDLFVGALITSGLRTRVEGAVETLLPITVRAAESASEALGQAAQRASTPS